MNSGNAAEWAQAVFGSGATVIALVALRAERRDRKAAEARLQVERQAEGLRRASRIKVEVIARTASQLEEEGHESPSGVRAILTVRVKNTSDEPVDEITIRVPDRRRVLDMGEGDIGVFPPADVFTERLMPDTTLAESWEWNYVPEWSSDYGDGIDEVVVVWRDVLGSWWSWNAWVVAPATNEQRAIGTAPPNDTGRQRVSTL